MGGGSIDRKCGAKMASRCHSPGHESKPSKYVNELNCN